MKRTFPMILSLVGALIVCAPALGQPAAEGPAPACPAQNCGRSGLSWTFGCFPRCGCPDDYRVHPYPRQCWPPYLPFYRCVPASDCAAASDCGRQQDRLTWWFIPTPQALRDAVWWRP
jgi:hypothetical protein